MESSTTDTAETDPAASDEAAIRSTLMAVLQAFGTGTASGMAAYFTPDVDWTNAFGVRIRGRDAVEEYLAGLFENENFSAGHLSGSPDVSIQRLSEDVVVAHVVTGIVGQQTQDGGQLGDRKTNSLHVLQRQDDGTWLIATELFADARTEATYLD